jgi:hypothetical protein
MRVIDNKIFTITAITFLSTLVASPSLAGVLCNIGEKRVRQDVIVADAFSEECFASCASKSDQATYNAPPGWAIVRYWTTTRHDRGRTTRSLSFATAQSNFASSSDFSSARSQEASGSAGQYNAGYSASAKQIESIHNAYRASNTTITLTVSAQGRSPYAGSSKREEALNVEELCIGTIDDYRAAIRDELSLAGSQNTSQNLEAQQKIIGFYRDFLSREPRPDEIDFRMDAFRKGYPLERQRTDIAFSDEVRQKIVGFYRQYLGRDPESGAVEFRMNALLNGRTLEQQRMDIQGR